MSLVGRIAIARPSPPRNEQGSPLGQFVKCPSCQQPVVADAAFCGHCGVRLAGGRSSRPTAAFAQTASRGMHRLVGLRSGGTSGTVLVIPHGVSLLGRGDVPLKIQDPFLSQRHLEVRLAGDQLAIAALGTGAVFSRLREAVEIVSGDELRLGRQWLRVDLLPAPQFTPDAGRVWGSPSRGALFRVLQLLEGSGEGEAIALGEGEYLLGREEGAMVFPDDPSVSRRHAVLAIVPGRATVQDLESANGTFLRLRRETFLSAGDVLLLGSTQWRYEVVPD